MSSSRSGAGASAPGRDCATSRSQVLFAKSKYAERLPIGKPEILKSFPPSELRDFYTKRYRPDRMAVVAVGDMDPGALERYQKGVRAPDEAHDARAATR